MIPALIVFVITYILMLSFQRLRPYIALCSAAVMLVMGYLGVFEMTPASALKAVDYNVLLMISATMCIVTLFIESRMPARMAELMMARVPNVLWAVTALSLFAGIVSAFVDNVATLLMVAPVGLAISRKLKISPVPVLIAIAVSSNLQGAATLVGDTTGFSGEGTYKLDEAAKTATVKIDAWDDEKVYEYTLDGDKLDLSSAYSHYHLVKQ